MIKVGGKNFNPLKPKPNFLAKKGGKPPKITQNSTNSDLAQIFRVSWIQKIIKVGDKNFYPNWAKIRFLAKKGGGEVESPQNQPKTQSTQIWLKFSG